jgi:hypothetical protein
LYRTEYISSRSCGLHRGAVAERTVQGAHPDGDKLPF